MAFLFTHSRFRRLDDPPIRPKSLRRRAPAPTRPRSTQESHNAPHYDAKMATRSFDSLTVATDLPDLAAAIYRFPHPHFANSQQCPMRG